METLDSSVVHSTRRNDERYRSHSYSGSDSARRHTFLKGNHEESHYKRFCSQRRHIESESVEERESDNFTENRNEWWERGRDRERNRKHSRHNSPRGYNHKSWDRNKHQERHYGMFSSQSKKAERKYYVDKEGIDDSKRHRWRSEKDGERHHYHSVNVSAGFQGSLKYRSDGRLSENSSSQKEFPCKRFFIHGKNDLVEKRNPPRHWSESRKGESDRKRSLDRLRPNSHTSKYNERHYGSSILQSISTGRQWQFEKMSDSVKETMKVHPRYQRGRYKKVGDMLKEGTRSNSLDHDKLADNSQAVTSNKSKAASRAHSRSRSGEVLLDSGEHFRGAAADKPSTATSHGHGSYNYAAPVNYSSALRNWLKALLDNLPNNEASIQSRRGSDEKMLINKEELDFMNTEFKSTIAMVNKRFQDVEQLIKSLSLYDNGKAHCSTKSTKEAIEELKRICNLFYRLLLDFTKNYRYNGQEPVFQKPNIIIDRTMEYFLLFMKVQQLVMDKKYKGTRIVLLVLQYRLQRLLRSITLKYPTKPPTIGSVKDNEAILLNILTAIHVRVKGNTEHMYTEEQILEGWHKIRCPVFHMELAAGKDDDYNIGYNGFKNLVDLCIKMEDLLSEDEEQQVRTSSE